LILVNTPALHHFKKLRPTQFQQPRQALPSYGTAVWAISIPESCMTCQFGNLTSGFLRHLIIELGFISTEPTLIFVDNLSCIKIVKNPVFHNKTKHFELHYH
jgi:hypothetical protein